MLGIVLNLVFVCVEFGAGLWFDSVALISDAGHNLSDVVSLVLSLIAFRLARVKPTASYTYGYRKSTVLVSLLNACILLVAVGIDSERVRRSITETDPRIEDVHHVHIWAISTTQNALTAHVVVRSLDDAEELKHEIKHRLEHEGIGHATLEFELCGEHCAKECPECR